MEQPARRFHLEIGEPVLVTQGAVGDRAWGHYNFPSIKFTDKGHILVGWQYSADDIDYQSAPEDVLVNMISEDEGKTFRPPCAADGLSRNHAYASRTKFVRMKNGKDFIGFQIKGAYPAEYINKYTPAYKGRIKNYYFVEDIAETEDTTVYAIQRDPVTGEEETFACDVRWPYSVLQQFVHRGLLFPHTMTFALHGCNTLVDINGDLYIVVYACGPDSEAKTREEAIHKYMDYSGCYVFKSADCGHTWEYVSQVLVDDDTFSDAKGFEGLDEPHMKVMPDGSVAMLMRTGSTHPSYITHSTDLCKTWSKPQIFDDCGVLPCLLPLKCGVTLASYGRPVLKVRATVDPAGMVWEDPIQIPLHGMHKENHMDRSCFYTQMVALDDKRALVVFADSQYPNEDGEPTKAICVREIRVVFED